MKREERTVYNQMKKLDTAGLMHVEIPTNYSHEARQAIHEALMFRGMVATRVNWLKDDVYALHYIPTAGHAEREAARQKQEARDVDEITAALPHSDFTWNGYQNPATVTEEEETETETETTETETETEEQKPMKITATTAREVEELARRGYYTVYLYETVDGIERGGYYASFATLKAAIDDTAERGAGVSVGIVHHGKTAYKA